MSSNFVIIGNRVINLEHVAAAERDGNRGRVTVYFAAGGGGGSGSAGDSFKWTFERGDEADVIWNKLTAGRADMTDLGGGPESITDNESTASRQPRE
jgi:hypothetical protein